MTSGLNVKKVLEEHVGLTEDDLLLSLQSDGGSNPLARAMLDLMIQQLSEARTAYFRKPTIAMSFGASRADADRLAQAHPELRELVFDEAEALPDAHFQGTRHLAVRRTLLQLLSADSALVGDPYAHQILIDGVIPHEHNFVFRTNVPIVDMTVDSCDKGSRHLLIADLCRSKHSFKQLMAYSAQADVAEALIVAPYDPDMWNVKGSHVRSGGYVFDWSAGGRESRGSLEKPVRLQKDFFTNPRYKDQVLRIQPYGSSKAITYTRNTFVSLFLGGESSSEFVETRSVRNGFAEVSIINFRGVGLAVPEKAISRATKKAIKPGFTEIEPVLGSAKDELLMFGRHRDLDSVLPVRVPTQYYQRALKFDFTVKPGRNLLQQMLRHLHAYSAQLVYDGAVVRAESMIDPEHMCVVAERIIYETSGAKRMLSRMGAQAKVPLEKKPLAIAQSLIQWAASMAVNSSDLQIAAKQTFGYLQGTSGIAPGIDVAAVPLRFQPATHALDIGKREVTDIAIEAAESMFGPGHDLPYHIVREEITVDKSQLFQLRLLMKTYATRVVDINSVQFAYDLLFPKNSLIDPTMVQLQAESGNTKFIIDVQYFKTSVPSLFSELEGYQVIPSKLRTSIGADLMGSFRTLMSSLMKRNFNRPRPEAYGDRRAFVQRAVDRVFNKWGGTDKGVLLARYASDPIIVSGEVIEMWARNHTQSDVLAAATLLERDPDPTKYNLMPKDVPKPTLSLEAQGTVAVGQTIVFHTKDTIALTVGMFVVVIERLLALFPTSVRFAFGADEHTSGQWADTYLDLPDTYVYELDVPKFDKSQDWACYELVLYVLEMTGVHPDLILFWRKASGKSTIFNSTFHLVFETMFGNRSGNGGTLAVNCVVLLFAYLETFDDLGIVALLVKGDDSVLVTRRPLRQDHSDMLLHDWGFTLKQVQKRGVTGFCSSVFVKDSTGHYQLVRDVVRVIEKFGRALSVNKPASYFLDYYSSVVDTAIQYEDPVLVSNLVRATNKLYGQQVDVPTMVDFVKYVSSSSRVFLHELYGLTSEQIEGIVGIDNALETLYRVRSTRFTKGKDLADLHPELRKSLVDKVMLSVDWIYAA